MKVEPSTPSQSSFISPKTRKKFDRLVELLKSSTKLLIVLQDSPDPDAIAAAIALRKLANTVASLRCSIAHGGTIGRGENRALVRYLNLNLHSCSELDFQKFSTIATVDTQPGTGNNSLPSNIIPDIVIDHHPLRPPTRSAHFYDVRPNYGATSTILLEYLLCADIVPDVPLATALLYAIRSDTQDFGRQATNTDIQAVTWLFPTANKRMLGEIQRGSVPRQYFRSLLQAIQNARIYDPAIVSHLGDVDTPDVIAEASDLLLREDHATWTMCTGFYNNKMFLSIRNRTEERRADLIARRIVGRKGTAGGHPGYAGGQIPLNTSSDQEKRKLEKLTQKRFLRTIGSDHTTGLSLTDL